MSLTITLQGCECGAICNRQNRSYECGMCGSTYTLEGKPVWTRVLFVTERSCKVERWRYVLTLPENDYVGRYVRYYVSYEQHMRLLRP